ncbi:MAG: FGGY-family carbohydrate kinase, partial [Anaerolineae bacterium]
EAGRVRYHYVIVDYLATPVGGKLEPGSDVSDARWVGLADLENLEITEEVAGPAGQALLYGGGAKSALWRQIIADVLGRPIGWTATAETAGLGAAMLAGVGCGVFATVDEAVGAMRPAVHVQEPTGQTTTYDDLYTAYRHVEAQLLRDLS